MASQAVVAEAFCPAHITGFFKAHACQDSGGGGSSLLSGSTGAGFSLAESGVTTRVVRKEASGRGVGAAAATAAATGADGRRPAYTITTSGYPADRTDVSRAVAERFLDAAEADVGLAISHEISAPVGYGLGSSGAAALSLAYALDCVLGTNMSREEIGSIAHAAEIDCKTGLGDVLASYHGGFEIRTAPGAPGTGRVEKIEAAGDISVAVICLGPVSTSRFISEHLPRINGLGGRMIEELKRSRDYEHFQDMSLQFADRIGVITPEMRTITDELAAERIGCGVALLGQTVFCMAESGSAKEQRAGEILDRYRRSQGPAGKAIIIKSGIDWEGARLLRR